MNVNCVVTMGLVPEIKYLVSCIYHFSIAKFSHAEEILLKEKTG